MMPQTQSTLPSNVVPIRQRKSVTTPTFATLWVSLMAEATSTACLFAAMYLQTRILAAQALQHLLVENSMWASKFSQTLCESPPMNTYR